MEAQRLPTLASVFHTMIVVFAATYGLSSYGQADMVSPTTVLA